MVFTLASHLKESLAELLIAKKEAAEAAENEKARQAEEVRRCPLALPALPDLLFSRLKRREQEGLRSRKTHSQPGGRSSTPRWPKPKRRKTKSV